MESKRKNKPKNNELVDTENRLVVIGVRVLEVGRKGKMVKRYKAALLNKSYGSSVQHGEYS